MQSKKVMRMESKNVVVGAGIAGLTIAERLADAGERVLVVEKRNHIGGNCYDFYNRDGLLVHRYGPHIFHTSIPRVWEYLSQFTEWVPYVHRVLAKYKNKLYPIPINLDTINRFFDKRFTSKEAREFLEDKRIKLDHITNSRDIVVSKVGEELYEAFIKHYSYKQWGCYPEELDKEVLERIPLHFNRDNLYFSDPYQGIPRKGYTAMFNNMVGSSNIDVMLNTDYLKIIHKLNYCRLFMTSSIDEFFDYRFGRLPYRCIDFRFETIDKIEYQGNSVINYTEEEPEYTRVTEFKKLTMQDNPKTTICREYPMWEGEPSYPVPRKDNRRLYERYILEGDKLDNVYFVGRLAEYRYLNMDQACYSALELINRIINDEKDD